MVRRRSILLLLAGTAVFVTIVVCGYGAAAPVPTVDLNQPSGGGGSSEPTAASAFTEVSAPTQASAPTSIPSLGQPTATGAFIPVTGAPPPAIPESRRLTLEYPPTIRAGDSDVIRLTLEVDTLGNVTPTAEVQGHAVTGKTVEIPNLYDTHNVIAEARLDLAGVEVRPSDDVSQPLLPSQAVTFYWSVHPTSAGTYRGTAWLFLRFVDKATKAESRKALTAQPVQISATDLFGLNGNFARAAGGLGSVVGGVLGFPFVDEVLKWLWKRVRRPR